MCFSKNLSVVGMTGLLSSIYLPKKYICFDWNWIFCVDGSFTVFPV